MAGRLPMGQKELVRSKMLEMVKQGLMTLKAATVTMKASYRQGIRLYAAYRKEGDTGPIHGNCQRVSNNRLAQDLREKISELYRTRYNDFGPTFAAEKLAEEEGIQVSAGTLRNLLIEAGEWQGNRRRKGHRSRRERRGRFGELVQFDGSHHRWFEERGPSCCLMTMIDDATNTRISRFFEQETAEAGMSVFSLWITDYGIPQTLYCDKKNAFVLTREPTDAELLAGVTEGKSHFGRVCDKLGVQVTAANSPQAKGRVERNHGIDQDRLVKELRRAGISTIEHANAFLEKTYLPRMNKKFGRPASSSDGAHVPVGNAALNDYVIRFDKRLFQILKSNRALPRPKDTVIVRVQLDGGLSIIHKGTKLFVKELTNTQGQDTQDVA